MCGGIFNDRLLQISCSVYHEIILKIGQCFAKRVYKSTMSFSDSRCISVSKSGLTTDDTLFTRAVAKICCRGGAVIEPKFFDINFAKKITYITEITQKNQQIYITPTLSFNHRSYILVIKNPKKIFSTDISGGGMSPLFPFPTPLLSTQNIAIL